jgi:hypothetical protein
MNQVYQKNGDTYRGKKTMNVIRIILIPLFLFCLQGCMAPHWEIRQVETTFVNQDTSQDYVQKNAVLVNSRSGQTWVLSSDVDSNYYWMKLPLRNPDGTDRTDREKKHEKAE